MRNDSKASLLEKIWRRKHKIVQLVRSSSSLGLALYRFLPIPHKTRIVLKDMIFLSLDMFVLRSSTYQSWLKQRSGARRINAIFNDEAAAKENLAPVPSTPTELMWNALPTWAHHRGDRVRDVDTRKIIDVIMPVYSGLAETLNAIYSVLASPNKTPFELVVINDRSPDDVLAASLRRLSAEGLFTLLEHDKNQGFVATVNRGMRLHEVRDVVLLNADTEVYNNWLDRLCAVAYAEEATGTVTPLSNNAEICSYPYFVRDNWMALELPYGELDALAANVNEGLSCDVPTAVGFCMFIKRSCLKQVGYFDEETFGRGYGEENDFCLRALRKGWKHKLAGEIFVRHLGGTSFAGEKQKRVEKALKIINNLYPDYAQSVQRFIADDPALPLRRNLDVARLRRACGQGNMLLVSHNLGGGTHKHLLEMAQELQRENIGAFLLQPVNDLEIKGIINLSHTNILHTPNLDYSMELDQHSFFSALLELAIGHVHIHHTISFEQRIVDFITELSKALDVAYDVTVHDYYYVCPRINMVDGNDFYCGEPEMSDCERCITSNPSHAGAWPVWQWRLQYQRLLENARKVFVPDMDVEKRILTYFPQAPVELKIHAESFSNDNDLNFAPRDPEETLQVAIIGALSGFKGANVLNDLLGDAFVRNLHIHFTIIGYANHPNLYEENEKLTITGAYKDEDMRDLLEKNQPHLIFVASVWPETYCYALSHAFRFGIPAVAFDLGAHGRRVKEAGGVVLPLELAKNPAALNDTLLAIDTSRKMYKPDDVAYANLLNDYYGLAVNEVGVFVKLGD